MLKRKIEQQLLKWKADKEHLPLIIKGCRQCGKTTSVMEFAKKYYKQVIYLNFFERHEYREIFSGSLKVDDIIMLISAFFEKPIIFEPGATVIVLDEIQECPQARTALKFFKIDGRFDIIGTGSLLGVKGFGKEPASVPVGYETVIDMYPMDFEEFLWANNVSEAAVETLKKCLSQGSKVPSALHNRFRELFLQYIVIGGMPDVVRSFMDTHDMGLVLQKQQNIVRAYKDDMVKYAMAKDKTLITECFESIPKQLSKENKKFQYSIIKKGSTAAKFNGSLQWIEEAGIIRRCYNLSITELPLDGNATDVFKVYMQDTGLFISMLEEGTQYAVLNGDLLSYKGAIFENIIADILSKMGRKLYYFRKDSGLELDFVIRWRGKCTPLEVKAVQGNAKSLRTVLQYPEKYKIEQAIKFGDYNVGRNGKILILPLYMAFLLQEY